MKQISTFNTKKDRTSLVFYMIFIIIGIATGAILAYKSHFSACIWINQCLFTMSFPLRDSVNTLLSLIIFLGAAYLSGLFAFGQVCGFILLIYRGIGIGVSASLMYAMYGKSAIIPVIITFLPKASAVVFIASVAIRESVRNSRAIFEFCISGYDSSEKSVSFKLYCLRFIVLIIFSILISAADGALVHFYCSFSR